MNLSAIITALGGRSTLQQLLNVGPSAISNYMTRGHLPNRVKPIIYAALTAKGYRVRADDLEILAPPSNRIMVSEMITTRATHFINYIRRHCRLQGARDRPAITKAWGSCFRCDD